MPYFLARGKALFPAYRADNPSSSSIRRSWLYFAIRSLRLADPVLIIPQSHATAAGFSQYRPVAKNDSPKNRAQNRRIEIALTAAEPLPVVEAR